MIAYIQRLSYKNTYILFEKNLNLEKIKNFLII